MNKQKSKRLLSILIAPIVVVIYLLSNTELNSNILRINNWSLVKKDNSFEAYHSNNVLIAKNIDSIIVTPRYGSMIYGSKTGNEKLWYYIDVSSSINVYGGYSDKDFRDNQIVTIGRAFLDSVKTPQEIWARNNEG